MFALAAAITVFAGFVKGSVGFAMPTIMISGLGAFLAPDVALAALIVPTLLSNVWQALRGGIGAAIAAMKKFRLYISIVLILMVFSAQLVAILPSQVLLLILGVPITVLSGLQLSGWQLTISPAHRRRAEVLIAAFAGFLGGMSGVWGPPTVAYLTAINTPKSDHFRVQGVVYGLGAIVLFLAHLRSGILNAQTVPFSVILVVPALIGLVIGFRFHDHMDQARFRQMTLWVLIIAGLNLVRRGFFG